MGDGGISGMSIWESLFAVVGDGGTSGMSIGESSFVVVGDGGTPGVFDGEVFLSLEALSLLPVPLIILSKVS